MQSFKIIVEKHKDGYVAYPLGLKGVVVGEGDTYEDAVADAISAIEFHIETFGTDFLEAYEQVQILRHQLHLNRIRTFLNHLKPCKIVLQRQLMRHNMTHID